MARQTVDDMYTQVAVDWLDHQPELTDVQQDFLEKVMAFYEHLPEQLNEDPSLRFEAAQACYRVGAIELQLRHYEPALTYLNKSLSQYKQLRRKEPVDPQCVSAMGMALHRLGHLHRREGRLAEAISSFVESLKLATQASAGDPENAQPRREVARLHSCLAQAYAENKQSELASDHLRTAIRQGEQLLDQFPDDPRHQSDVIQAIAELSDITPSDEEHRSLICDANQRAQRLLDEHPSSKDARFCVALCSAKLAVQMAQSKRFDQAIAAGRTSIHTFEQLANVFPDGVVFREYLVQCHLNQMRAFVEAAKLDNAETEARESVAVARSTVADRPNEPSLRRHLTEALQNHGWRLQAGTNGDNRPWGTLPSL